MTKKQFGIIMTLMALIVCVGVLSVRLNNENLNDPSSGLAAMLEDNDVNEEGDKAVNTQDYFIELRAEKDSTYQTFVDSMNTIKEDESASQEQKDIANNSLIQKAELKEQENKVELMIGQQGYEDVVCMVNEESVIVYVNIDEELSSTDAAMIQQTVIEVTNKNDVVIEAKK